MKTAVLITARLKSIRLPLKVIREIKGKPMIVHMLDRLKLSVRSDGIIICTSPLSQDDPLEEIARDEGVHCFRGHPDDVLLRLTNAAREYGLDTVVNCTADNPFTDPEYIDLLIEYHLARGNDYTKSDGLPWGVFSYGLESKAMERACRIKDAMDTEVWGGYFTDTEQFKWSVMEVTDEAVRWPELRLTVDTPEDFELVSRIFDELYEPDKVFPLRDIVALCRRCPDLVAINSSVQQKAPVAIRLKGETGGPQDTADDEDGSS